MRGDKPGLMKAKLERNEGPFDQGLMRGSEPGPMKGSKIQARCKAVETGPNKRQ